MAKQQKYDLRAAPVGAIVDVYFNKQFWTYEKREDGWYMQGDPIIVMTEVLQIGKQAFYRWKGAPIKTGHITEIVPRT